MADKKTTFEAKRGTLFNFDPDNLVVIGVDTKDGPEHELWDERINLPLDETMILSMMNVGVLEVVIVRKSVDGIPEVVNGRRRVLHARKANKRLQKVGEPLITVPAKVERGDEDHMFHVMVATNEIRVDDDVLVKATKCARMLARNPDVAQAALAFGVSKTTISNWRKLVELPPQVKKAVSAGVLSTSAASKLHGMPKEEQLAELERVQKASASNGGKRVTASKVNGKTEPAKKGKKPTKAQLSVYIDKLSHNTDKFSLGVIAGMQMAIDGEHADVKALLKG